jgi:hypothetical protein
MGAIIVDFHTPHGTTKGEALYLRPDFKKVFGILVALASRVTVACRQRKHSAQDYSPVPRWVIKAPELWRRGFEAKANFGSAALPLT